VRGLRQLTGVVGIASVGLIVIAFLGGTPPATDDSGQTVLAYASDHRTLLLVVFFAFGIATCLALLFFAGVRRILATPQEPDHDLWSSAMFGSAIAVFTLGLAGQACTAALAFRADGQSPQMARTLWDLFVVLINASNLVTVLLGVAAAIAIVQTRQLPSWLGVGAAIFAAAHLGATLSWARSGAFSQTGVLPSIAPMFYLAWVLAVSISLLQHPPAAS
jgi:hypothetical protein